MFRGWYGLNERAQGLGFDFFEASKLGTVAAAVPSWSGRDLFLMSRGLKQFSSENSVSLESLDAESPPNIDFYQVIRTRRSSQAFAGSVAIADLARILNSALGVTSVAQVESVSQALYASPSSGGLRSFDAYIVASRVQGLSEGIYHYNPLRSQLELLNVGIDSALLAEVFFGQTAPREAAFHIVLVSVLQRLSAKYGDARSHRLALLDAGHAGQNLVLCATAAGLAACPYQAFNDDRLARLLNVDGVHEVPVHLLVGGG